MVVLEHPLLPMPAPILALPLALTCRPMTLACKAFPASPLFQINIFTPLLQMFIRLAQLLPLAVLYLMMLMPPRNEPRLDWAPSPLKKQAMYQSLGVA